MELTSVESFESAPMLAVVAMLMAGADSEVTFTDRVEGTTAVRRHFIEGGVDFVVSGVPFDSAEKKELADAGREVISAPVQAVGLSVFGFAPSLPVFPGRCAEVDPDSDDGCTMFDSTRYDGPVRLTPKLLADLFYERANIWLQPDLAKNLALPADGSYFLPPIYGPRPLVRLDGDATNLYLDRYLAAKVPDERRQALAGVPGANVDAAPTETWPLPLTPARKGQDNLVAQISNGLDPGAGGQSVGGSVGIGGEFAAISMFETNLERPVEEQIGLFRVSLLNDSGRWVAPGTESISAGVDGAGGKLAAAVAAGDTASIAALAPAAEAEYPITWVNRLHAPATGLTPAKVNAIASLIRVQVTVGQSPDLLDLLGDGRLNAAMVTEALASADRLVRSNCEAAKGKVVMVEGLGPFVPGVVGGPAEVSLCSIDGTSAAADSPPSVGGVSSGGSPGGDYSASGFGDYDYDYTDMSAAGYDGYTDASGSYDAVGAGSATGASTSGPGGAGAATDGEEASLIATRMPLALPGLSLAPLNRAVTLAMGAAAFLLGRRAWVRRQGLV